MSKAFPGMETSSFSYFKQKMKKKKKSPSSSFYFFIFSSLNAHSDLLQRTVTFLQR